MTGQDEPHIGRLDQDTPALVVLTNARIHTCDPARPAADMLVIDGQLLTYVGSATDLPALDQARTIDLGGRTVIPGMVDAHTHPSMVTQSLWRARLPWTTDVDELLAAIASYAEEHPPEEIPFLYFEYYPSSTFTGSAPTKELLDRVVADRPVLCQDFNEHAAWVNSRMLELMGVTALTPDPVPGFEVFVRDADGEPTGHVLEMVHLHFLDTMYETLRWRPPEELTPERLAPFLQFMTQHGVTALLEAWVEDEQVLASVAEMDRRGELDLYYQGALRFRSAADLPEVIARAHELDQRHGTDRVSVTVLKLFLDGTNEVGNSSLLAPTCHSADDADPTAGMGADELATCLRMANAAQLDVHIHLVGDRAFRVACDAVQAARSSCPSSQPWQSRVTLAHCELVDPADMGRPAELDIIVNWTAHWSGGYFGEEARRFLGDDRWNRMYRFDQIARSGAPLTFSSDVVTGYELHRANPLLGMQIATTRVDPEFPLDPARFPGSVRPPAEAALTRQTLLEGYTRHGAEQLHLSDRMGSLEVGKLANLSVLGADPLEVHDEDLQYISFDAVLFEGRVVHGSL